MGRDKESPQYQKLSVGKCRGLGVRVCPKPLFIKSGLGESDQKLALLVQDNLVKHSLTIEAGGRRAGKLTVQNAKLALGAQNKGTGMDVLKGMKKI